MVDEFNPTGLWFPQLIEAVTEKTQGDENMVAQPWQPEDTETTEGLTAAELGGQYLQWFERNEVPRALACLFDPDVPPEKRLECWEGIAQTSQEQVIQQLAERPWIFSFDPSKTMPQIVKGFDKDRWLVVHFQGKPYAVKVMHLAGYGLSIGAVMALFWSGVGFFALTRTKMGRKVLRAFGIKTRRR